MKEKQANIINRILLKRRALQIAGESGDESSPWVASLPVFLVGTFCFAFLCIVIWNILFAPSPDNTLGATFGLIVFLLVVFLWFPMIGVGIAIYHHFSNLNLSGTWISTRHALFHRRMSGESLAIQWKDVRAVEKKGNHIVFRSRNQTIAIPAKLFDVSDHFPHLWFLNWLIEDFGRDRPEAKLLWEIREKLIYKLLRRYANHPSDSFFDFFFYLVFPFAIFFLGMPVYWYLQAQGDPILFYRFAQTYIWVCMFSPILAVFPIRRHAARVEKRNRILYDETIFQRLNDPLSLRRATDRDMLPHRRRKHIAFKYETEEEVVTYLATIPAPPRRVSPEVRWRFLFGGIPTLSTVAIAIVSCLFSLPILFPKTDDDIRYFRFWDWSTVGTGTVVKVVPHYKVGEDKKNYYAGDKIFFSFQSSNGKKHVQQDARVFGEKTYTAGQTVPIQWYRGNPDFLRLESKVWLDGDIWILFSVYFISFFLLLPVLIGWVATLRDNLRFWERGVACMGKVARRKQFIFLRVERPGEPVEEIQGIGGGYGLKDNINKPFPLLLDPDNPKVGKIARSIIPFGTRMDTQKGELVVEPKSLWVWPVVGLICILAIVMATFAVLKLM